MNIVFDEGVTLDDQYRQILAPLLPPGNAPLQLDAFTGKIDGTPSDEEGFVFLTHLPTDVLRYHISFFQRYSNAPAWFLILLNRNDYGLTRLKNAVTSCNLKNSTLFHCGNPEAFENAVQKIVNTPRPTKGKVLLFSKHQREWPSKLAKLLFAEQTKRYEIGTGWNLPDTTADTLFLCGEQIRDFIGIQIPQGMEPYFVFRYRKEPQHRIHPQQLITDLAGHYKIAEARVQERLFFVDLENEAWLWETDQPTGEAAVLNGIVLLDEFGLPVSRKQYTQGQIAAVARRSHQEMDRLKSLFQK